MSAPRPPTSDHPGQAPPRAARAAAADSDRRWRPTAPKRPWRSVRVRITAVATLVFAITFAGAAFFLVLRVQTSLEDAVRRESNTAIAMLTTQLQDGTNPDEAIRVLGGSGIPVQVLTVDGKVVATSPGIAADSASAPVPAGPTTGSGVAGPGGGPSGNQTYSQVIGGSTSADDVLRTTTAVQTPEGTFTIVAESPLASVQQSVETIAGILTVGTPLLIAAFAVMVWILVGRALRPVEVMRAEVDEISHTTMHRRVREPGSNDEVDRLAVTMNEMLDRLESASDRQRQFVSDASHELKTPLATIRTSVEVALRDPDRADWPTTARRVLDADRAMTDLVANLLDLARLEEHPRSPAVAPDAPVVDLEEVVMLAVDERRPDLAAAAGAVTIDVSQVLAGRVRGDRGELTRLVANLLDNAERHGARRVAVAVTESDGRALVTVDDDGPGIAADQRLRVFDRFTQLDGSRSSTTGGTGLGLAIVKAIAEHHGGSVHIDDSPFGGARFVVTLPAAGALNPDTGRAVGAHPSGRLAARGGPSALRDAPRSTAVAPSDRGASAHASGRPRPRRQLDAVPGADLGHEAGQVGLHGPRGR